MLSVLLLTLLVLPLIYVLQSCWCLRRNIAAAKATGLSYVVVPWNGLNIPWLILRPIILPYLKRLPIRDKAWFRLLNINWPWQEQYSIFHELGSDSFITVSPTGNYFNTADASVIDQITKRRLEFPKPIELYGGLDLYGKNVVSTEGSVWKQHRKTVSPPFNEKNNRLVWLESLRQGQSMINGWVGDKSSSAVSTVADDCMRLSLHVISCAGFGVKMNWPRSQVEGRENVANGSISPTAEKESQDSQFGPGHSMSYTDALSTLLHSMIWVFIFPKPLLSMFHPRL